MNDLKTNMGNEKMPSILKDPFNKTSVKRIYVSYSEFMRKWSANGSIEFSNGNTSGEQKFTANTFDEVVAQMKAFLEDLNVVANGS